MKRQFREYAFKAGFLLKPSEVDVAFNRWLRNKRRARSGEASKQRTAMRRATLKGAATKTDAHIGSLLEAEAMMRHKARNTVRHTQTRMGSKENISTMKEWNQM